ncbi:MAG: hypothetical protein HN576_03640 [Bacteriovoracaceae bacterium]|jgi:hypothetical protein|nr:hypothetical protein [Bacteriovoracaceae bacterium]
MTGYISRNHTKKFSNEDYRKWFMNNCIPKFYNPSIHVLFNIGVLLAIIFFHFLRIEEFNQWSFIVMLIMLPVGNLTVTLIHQYPLHKRLKYWSFPYDAHTVQHHRFYTSEHILMNHKRELFVVMFPWFVVLGFATIIQPLFFYIFKILLGANLGHVISGSAACYFVFYEFVHTSNHLPLTHVVYKIPGMKAMRDHHLIHHNPKLMGSYNMGIVFPWFDYIFGTKWKSKDIPPDNINDHFIDLEKYKE